MKQDACKQRERPLPADWLLQSGGCFESLSLYFYALWKQKAIRIIVKNGPDFFLSLRQSVLKVSTNSLKKNTKYI